MIISTQFLPVSGNVQLLTILCEPSSAECIIVTTTFVLGADTRSMAPPIPFTSLPYTQSTNIQILNGCMSNHAHTVHMLYREELKIPSPLHNPKCASGNLEVVPDVGRQRWNIYWNYLKHATCILYFKMFYAINECNLSTHAFKFVYWWITFLYCIF